MKMHVVSISASPFKFLDSYTRTDIGEFFGRDKETDELFRQCFLSPILVVYGGSGTGKTSLVQCGLSSRFQDSDWLPIPVRRAGDMIDSVREAIQTVTLTPSSATDLGQLTANLYLDHFKPIYFLFDQFEELFIFGTHGECEAFFTALRDLLNKERNAHAIFVVREEYLAELTRYERIIPGLIENRYRVERLTQRHAMEVVEKLCEAHGIPCAEGFSAALVERLDPEGHGIELSYLQVFLDRCWRTRQGDESFSPALLERIGHVDDMLGAFLDEQVADTPEPQRAEALLKTFVSDQGTKRQLTVEEAHDWVQTIGTAMESDEVERLLQLFVAKRLLKDRDERGRYELLHDALARQIFQRITRAEQELIEVRQFVQQAYGQYEKRGAKLTANDLSYLRPYRNQLYLKGELKDFVEGAFGEAERKEKRKKLRTRVFIGSLLLVGLVGGIWLGKLHKRLKLEEAHRASVQLAEEAMELLSADPYTAYLLAEKAFETSPTFESEKALVHIYPFLYPEVNRFRGNGFKVLGSSKSILIFDDQNDRVALHDSTGQLLWEEKGIGMDAFMGVEVLDSAGVICLHGDRFVVRRINGEYLVNRNKAGPYVMSNKRKGLIAISENWMFRMDDHGSWDTLILDTAGVHKCLIGSLEFESDDEHRYAVVNKDSAVHIFDISSAKFDLVGRWRTPAALVGYPLVTKPGECVVLTDQSLHHLSWNGKDPIHSLKSIDLVQEGIRLIDGTPEMSSGISGVRNAWIRFRSFPARFYDPEHRVFLTLPDIKPRDILLGYDHATGRFAFHDLSRSSDVGPVVIRSLDGRSIRQIADHVSFSDVRMATFSEGITVSTHSRDRDEARITSYSWSGDTLWTRSMRTTKNDRGGSGHTLLDTGKDTHAHKGSVPSPSLRTPSLLSIVDANGDVKRLLLPRSKDGSHVESNVPFRNDCLVIYSDSLIAQIKLPWTRSRKGGRSIPMPQCDMQGHPYAIQIENGHLLHRKGAGTTSLATVDLHGCLDTIRTSGYMVGTAALAMSERWAYAFKYLGTFDRKAGWLVDLDHKVVLDTGTMREPSRYEFLPHGAGIARIHGDLVEIRDTTMHIISVIQPPGKNATRLARSGPFLLNADSIRHGVLHFVDLRNARLIRRQLPQNEEVAKVLSSVSQVSWRQNVHMDEQGVVYLHLGPSAVNAFMAQPKLKADQAVLAAIDRDGNVALLRGRKNVHLSHPEQGPMQIRLSSEVTRRTTRTALSNSTASHLMRYDSTSKAFELVEQGSEPRMEWSGSDHSILREGKVLWDLDGTVGIICDRYYYSYFRAVDHIERFPLYGADVIKEVREEKKFGAFWEHINAEPLIQKVVEKRE